MPRTIETQVYSFAELSEAAKETAREWFRGLESQDFDSEFVLEDADTIASLMGIEIDRVRVNLMGGGVRTKPEIYYSGFCSQGDGACFVGRYKYAKGSVAAVKVHAPLDSTLARIVQGLANAQKRHFYKLEARVTHNSRYYHARSTSIDVTHSDDEYRDIGESEGVIADLLCEFMDWIYERLEKEYEYRMSDESIDESILANEYEFDAEGIAA